MRPDDSSCSHRLQMWISHYLYVVCLREPTTDYRYESMAGPLSKFEITNSLICDWKSPIVGSLWLLDLSELHNSNLKFYITASQNGTARQIDESWCYLRVCIPISKTVLLANVNRYMRLISIRFSKWESPLSIQNIAVSQLLTFLTRIRICSLLSW